MKHDYTELDAALMDAIARLPRDFMELQHNQKISNEADKRQAAHEGYKPAWRFIDDRLQALRKAGKIRFSGAKWRAVPQPDHQQATE